jgi:hypothetical protein
LVPDFRHFLYPEIPLDDLELVPGKVKQSVDRQLPGNLMNKGSPTVNVDLNVTLNNIPYETHEGSGDIASIASSHETSFIATATEDGEV